MPLFEFHCPNCKSNFSQLIGMTADSPAPICHRCGCENINKLVSKFSAIRSESQRLDDLENSALSADMDSPAKMNRWMGEISKEMGEDFGNDFQEYLESEEDAVDDNPGLPF